MESKLNNLIHEHPVVLILETSDVISQRCVAEFACFSMRQRPICIDLDVREDKLELWEALQISTGKPPPAIFVGGIYLGDLESIISLKKEGKLEKLLHSMGLLQEIQRTDNDICEKSEEEDKKMLEEMGCRRHRRQSKYRLSI